MSNKLVDLTVMGLLDQLKASTDSQKKLMIQGELNKLYVLLGYIKYQGEIV